jgi:hypothetical protein
MSDRGHRINWVCPETAGSRYPSTVTPMIARKARKLIAQGKLDHAEAAKRFDCDLAELVAAMAPKRGRSGGKHGNRVLNVKPEDGASFDADRLPGEAVHDAFRRVMNERRYYLAWANATGCPLYSGLSPEPSLPQ